MTGWDAAYNAIFEAVPEIKGCGAYTTKWDEHKTRAGYERHKLNIVAQPGRSIAEDDGVVGAQDIIAKLVVEKADKGAKRPRKVLSKAIRELTNAELVEELGVETGTEKHRDDPVAARHPPL